MIKIHKTELVAVNALLADPLNPRTIDPKELQSLRLSLREYGFVDPVIARRKDLLLIGGHQRVRALLDELSDAGTDPATVKVPAVLLDLSDSKARALNLALNRISGTWDYQKLAEVLEQIELADDVDVAMTGFAEREAEAIRRLIKEDPMVFPTREQVEADVRALQRRFTFAVETDAQAAQAKRVLSKFGMTGPGNSGAAFAAAMATLEETFNK